MNSTRKVIQEYSEEIKGALGLNEYSSGPFAVLGLRTDATWKEVRVAYRKLSLIFHPDKISKLSDKYSEASLTAIFQVISSAYQDFKDGLDLELCRSEERFLEREFRLSQESIDKTIIEEKERLTKERATKEREAKERAAKERETKERETKERETKERRAAKRREEIVAEIKSKEYLDLSRMELDDQDIHIIAEELAGNRNLKKLDLSYNKISDQGMADIARALMTNNM